MPLIFFYFFLFFLFSLDLIETIRRIIDRDIHRRPDFFLSPTQPYEGIEKLCNAIEFFSHDASKYALHLLSILALR